MVNMSNYEEYMLLYADKELSKEEEQQLLGFVAKHPELQKELDAYTATQLVPDTAQVFAEKNELLKQGEQRKAIWVRGWQPYAAAASVVLFIVLFSIYKGDEEIINEKPVARNTTIAVPAGTVPEESITKKEEHQDDKLQSTRPVNAVAVETIAPAQQKGMTEEVPKATEKERQYEINTLPVSTGELIAVSMPQQHMSTIAVPDVTTEIEGRDNFTNLNLPLVKGSKELVNGVTGAISERVATAKAIRNDIKNTDLVVRLGQKELFTVRF